MTITAQTLKDFESRVAEAFNAGQIRAPVHLSGGNEDWLINYFAENYQEGDWVFVQWRSHYHCLLAGVPENELFEAILKGRSITLCFPKYNVFSSAIAGGHVPIAVGMAMAMLREAKDYPENKDFQTIAMKEYPENKDFRASRRVHCFLGDMTAYMGIYNECARYAFCNSLPVTFIEERNGLSVTTLVEDVWPKPRIVPNGAWTEVYDYDLAKHFPHAGAGKRVEF